MQSPLHGCRCTACGAPALTARGDCPDRVIVDAIVCGSCGATFDAVWGTPFLGHYQADDIPGLLEIAANARADNAYADRADVERLEDLLHRYHEASDRSQFLKSCHDAFAHASWFGHRYSEYSAFYALSKNIDFEGRDVLDVGAGTGYDAWRLVQAGGHVTAFEYNPVLIRRGRSVVPEARWIGGLAHVLPFGSETFDIVCCNAALHHMRDVPGAMHEMLRVLRPGGWLLTTGDPFRADDSGEETELEVFDNHPDALLGVNESIPRFAELVESLVPSQDRIRVRFLTSSGGERANRWRPSMLSRRRGPREHREWSFRQRKHLSTAAGSISMRVHVREPLRLPVTTQASTVLRAGEYARVLDDYEDALATLAPVVPSAFVDSPFPGVRQTKFELLNGWQKPRLGRDFRCGYKRARWFLTRPENSHTLRFCARAAATSQVVRSLEVRVAGVPVGSVPLGNEWADASVSVSHVPSRARFVCELHVIPTEADDLGFDDYRFAVKGRCFAQ
jgi:SAM-dependent methyltransferase